MKGKKHIGDRSSGQVNKDRHTAGDEDSQRKVSDQGNASSAASGRFRGSSGRSREDEDLATLSKQADHSEKDLNALEEEEISGSDNSDIRSVNLSDTDDDENEGLGDGKLGRTVQGEVDE
jgi:hypothetical protein